MNTILIIPIIVFSILPSSVFADEYTIVIPFGAFNPELNTPAEVWYDPPLLTIKIGDTITWKNNDREGHTVTSGQGSGRFGWMGDNFGVSDGVFDSDRFMPNSSWSYTFEETGSFRYFCTIHPWMESIIHVEAIIPDYPHDAFGNKLEKFPVIRYTADKLIEIDLGWEPQVILTNEKITFVYQTYDPASNSNLDKMSYDIIIIQSGEEVFRDSGITSVGGDYRYFVFHESGPIEIIFENIVSWGRSGIESTARSAPSDLIYRTAKFTSMVYENPEKIHSTETIIQPKQTFQLYYELAVVMIVAPAILFILVLWNMKSKTPISTRKSTAI